MPVSTGPHTVVTLSQSKQGNRSAFEEQQTEMKAYSVHCTHEKNVSVMLPDMGGLARQVKAAVAYL